jgi:hypothetical protein
MKLVLYLDLKTLEGSMHHLIPPAQAVVAADMRRAVAGAKEAAWWLPPQLMPALWLCRPCSLAPSRKKEEAHVKARGGWLASHRPLHSRLPARCCCLNLSWRWQSKLMTAWLLTQHRPLPLHSRLPARCCCLNLSWRSHPNVMTAWLLTSHRPLPLHSRLPARCCCLNLSWRSHPNLMTALWEPVQLQQSEPSMLSLLLVLCHVMPLLSLATLQNFLALFSLPKALSLSRQQSSSRYQPFRRLETA